MLGREAQICDIKSNSSACTTRLEALCLNGVVSIADDMSVPMNAESCGHVLPVGGRWTSGLHCQQNIFLLVVCFFLWKGTISSRHIFEWLHLITSVLRIQLTVFELRTPKS